jgi:hypothetical protein
LTPTIVVVHRGVCSAPASSEGIVLADHISHLLVEMDTITSKFDFFQTTSNGETLNMKVVDPKKL